MTPEFYKKIIIIGHTLKFPYGTGASARIANYARGFTAQGVSVTILCLKPYETKDKPVQNPSPSGSYCGAKFIYTGGTTLIAENRIGRWLQNVRGLLGALSYLLSFENKDRLLGILYYGIGYSSLYTLFGWFASRLTKTPFVGEVTEEPFVNLRDSTRIRFAKYLFWHLTAKLPDGMIVISKHLKNRFLKYVRKNTPVEIIPVVVDMDCFNNNIHFPGHYITFTGSLKRQGEADSLLSIWHKISVQFPDYCLRIVGDASSRRMMQLHEKVREYGIESTVTFTGFMIKDKIPEILQDSAVLVLPRESGLFSTAGLPNKLGEYLASGRPVLCTSVGDISDYLRDGENAYLVEPGNNDLFAERLAYILTNPIEAEKVGIRGRLAAERFFDLKSNSKKILNLLYSLNH